MMPLCVLGVFIISNGILQPYFELMDCKHISSQLSKNNTLQISNKKLNNGLHKKLGNTYLNMIDDQI